MTDDVMTDLVNGEIVIIHSSMLFSLSRSPWCMQSIVLWMKGDQVITCTGMCFVFIGQGTQCLRAKF